MLGLLLFFFFFNDTATTEIYTLSLHDALPILGKVTVADVLAAQPVTTNLLKFMRASIKMIGVSNLQSFIASMTQKLTLSDISDESKIILIKQELLLLVYELNRSGLLAENEKIRPILAQLEKLLLCDLSPSTNDSVKN